MNWRPNLSTCLLVETCGFSISESLGCILAGVILPKKGKLSLKEKDEENPEDFRKARRQHSAVESSISALKNHGLDRCPDHGID